MGIGFSYPTSLSSRGLLDRMIWMPEVVRTRAYDSSPPILLLSAEAGRPSWTTKSELTWKMLPRRSREIRATVMALCTHWLSAYKVTVPPRSRRPMTKEISLRTCESLEMRTVASTSSSAEEPAAG